MRAGWKSILALGFVGAVAVAGTAASQTADPNEKPSDIPKAEQRDEMKRGMRHFRGHRFKHHTLERVVHGEMKVRLPDGGFGTIVVDSGTVTAVNPDAGTLTIERADGESVTVTLDEETKTFKNREQVELSALEEGDIARIKQRDEGDGLKVARVIARTPRAESDAPQAAEPPATDTGLI